MRDEEQYAQVAMERLLLWLSLYYPGKEASQAVLCARVIEAISRRQGEEASARKATVSPVTWTIHVSELANHFLRLTLAQDPVVAVAALAVAIQRRLPHARVGAYADPDLASLPVGPPDEIDEGDDG